LYVDDKHHFLYCEVPKVACTNWKRVLLIMSGKMNTTDPKKLRPSLVHGELSYRYLRTLVSYSPDEIEYRLRNYFKVMFVRNPLERILSAYINKFTQKYSTYFRKRYGRRIVRRYRENPSEQSLQRGDDVTFNEFVQYILDPQTTQSIAFNAHWRQYYKLCRPCIVNYDYIGKYETLAYDVRNVLRKLNVSNIRFPASVSSGRRTADLVKSVYANISTEELHSLWKLYAVDFEMFGYKYPDFSRR
ncbi:Carbohydrate sulfotransferase 11, partial [Lamellibrachia satsuma]